MSVHGLDHYNLRAPQELLEELRGFYCNVVGLSVGDRPPFKEHGYWLYAGDKAILHLSLVGEDAPLSSDPTTFAHAAFACTDRDAVESRLAAMGIDYRTARVPVSGQVQLFLADPAGNGVELTFAPNKASQQT